MRYTPEDDCPGCEHKLSTHDEYGCTDGWTYYPSDSPNAGMSIDEGCECNLGIVD